MVAISRVPVKRRKLGAKESDSGLVRKFRVSFFCGCIYSGVYSGINCGDNGGISYIYASGGGRHSYIYRGSAINANVGGGIESGINNGRVSYSWTYCGGFDEGGISEGVREGADIIVGEGVGGDRDGRRRSLDYALPTSGVPVARIEVFGVDAVACFPGRHELFGVFVVLGRN